MIVNSETEDETLIRLRAAADIMSQIEDARESPIGLYKLLFRTKNGGRVIIKDFHYAWQEACLTYDRVLIEASRGLSKSSFLLAYVAWCIGKNPDIRAKFVCANDRYAEKRLSVLHEWLDKPESLYKLVFPTLHKVKRGDSKRPNHASTLNVERSIDTPEPTVEAKGVTSSGTGGRVDLLVLDDVVDGKSVIQNPALLPKIRTKVLLDWLPTVSGDAGGDSGQIIDLFTPWDRLDINAYFKKSGAWFYSKFAHGIPGNPFHSIFPEVYSDERLKRECRMQGEPIYRLSYNCDDTPSSTKVIIHPSTLRPYTADVIRAALPEVRVILSFDPASGRELTRASDQDYMGVSIIMFWQLSDTLYKILVPDAYQVLLPTIMQAQHIWDLAARWHPEKILVEAKGVQTLDLWLNEQQSKDPRLAAFVVEPITFGSISKGQRLQSTQPLFGTAVGIGDPVLQIGPGQVIYFHPRAIDVAPQPHVISVGGKDYEALRDLRYQLLNFPTRHDDIMDSLTQGLNYMQRSWLNLGGQQDREANSLSFGTISLR